MSNKVLNVSKRTCFKDCLKPVVVGGTFSPNQTSYAHEQQLKVECSSGFTKSGIASESTCTNGSFNPEMDVICMQGSYNNFRLFLL